MWSMAKLTQSQSHAAYSANHAVYIDLITRCTTRESNQDIMLSDHYMRNMITAYSF